MELDCNLCTVTNCFIKLCKPKSLGKLNKCKSFERLPKGQFIFYEGSFVHGIYIVNYGKVKVLSKGYNNKALTIRLAAPGHILGHRGFGHDVYSISAVTLEDTAVCYFESKLFNSVLQEDINLTYQLMLFYSDELRTAERRIKNLIQMTVREKVADALLMIKRCFGDPQKDQALLEVDLSRNELGEMVSLRHEQITRILSEFRKENIIELKGKKIKICNPEKLHQIILPYYQRNSINL